VSEGELSKPYRQAQPAKVIAEIRKNGEIGMFVTCDTVKPMKHN